MDEIHFARVLRSVYIAFVAFQDMTMAGDTIESSGSRLY